MGEDYYKKGGKGIQNRTFYAGCIRQSQIKENILSSSLDQS